MNENKPSLWHRTNHQLRNTVFPLIHKWFGSAWQAIKSKPWGQWLRFRWIAPSLERLTSIVLKLGTLLLVSFFVIFFIRLFKDQGYVLQSISVPQQLEQQGFTGQVIALRVHESLENLKEIGESVKADSLQLNTSTEDLDLAVLGVGLSLRNLAFQMREALGRENKTINGEITRMDNHYEAHLRMTGYPTIESKVKIYPNQEAAALDTLFRQLADGILFNSDPYRLALVYRYEERYDESIDAIRQILKTNEAEAHWAYLAWGATLRSQEKHHESIDKFERAINLKPDFTLPYINAAYAYESIGDIDRAVEYMETVIRLDPKEYWRISNMAWMLYSAGETQAAMSVLEDALERPDEEYDAIAQETFALNLAEMRLNDDDMEGAKVLIEKYTNRDGENPLAYLLQGVIAITEQDTTIALQYFRNGFELDPGDQMSINSNIGFANSIGRYDHAISIFKAARLYELNDNQKAWVYCQISNSYNSIGKTDSAFIVTRKALQLTPEDEDPYTAMAKNFLYAEQADSAYHYLSQAFELGQVLVHLELEKPPFSFITDDPRFQQLFAQYRRSQNETAFAN